MTITNSFHDCLQQRKRSRLRSRLRLRLRSRQTASGLRHAVGKTQGRGRAAFSRQLSAISSEKELRRCKSLQNLSFHISTFSHRWRRTFPHSFCYRRYALCVVLCALSIARCAACRNHLFRASLHLYKCKEIFH